MRTSTTTASMPGRPSSSCASTSATGPDDWTTRLIDELAAGGVDGMTVLDIGAGVGAVHHALLVAGARSAVDVDASGPYLDVARGEAERRGLGDRVTYRKGDAVALAPELDDADLVALDRVVCCYGDMPGLVGAAAGRTRRRLGDGPAARRRLGPGDGRRWRTAGTGSAATRSGSTRIAPPT